MPKANILVLTANYGEGHRQAAVAIAQAFSRFKETVSVDVIDYVDMLHPVINSVTQYCYEQSVKKAPKLYGLFYKQTGKIHPASRFQRRVSQFGVDKLLDYIDNHKPSAIISTFPLPAGAVSWLKEQRLINVWAATVITDHAVHPQWIHDRTDHYYVGSSRVRDGLLRYGVRPNAIEETGIPIRDCFHRSYDRRLLRHKWRLDDRLTVLVMGGWHGVFNAPLCEHLIELGHKAQFMIVCGRDVKLHQRLWPLQVRFPNRVRVFGHVEFIPELMAVSDLTLTKAGGLTTSEALAMGLPMLLYRPIPGQEEQNANYLVSEGVACLSGTPDELIRNFERLTRHSERLTLMEKQAKRIQPSNVSNKIASSVLQRMRLSDTVFVRPKKQRWSRVRNSM